MSQLTHRSLCWIIGAALALAVLTPAPSRADTDPGSTPPSTPAPSPSSTDAGDLWRRVRHAAPHDDEQPAGVESHKPFFVVAPSVGSKPSTGLNAGLAGNVAFIDGDPRATHISSMSGGLKVSQKGQTLSGFKLAMFTPNDRWFIQGDNRLSWTSQNTYGLGGDTPAADAENLKYDALRLYETAYRSVAPGLFVGVGINVNRHTNVRPGTGDPPTFDQDAYVAYTEQHGFNIDRQTSSGTSVSLLFDTRDNAHQRATRLAGQRHVPDVLQRLPRRRFDVAGGLGRSAHVSRADARRTSRAGVLVPRRLRHWGYAAVSRSAGDRRRLVRTLGTRLRRGPLSRRSAAVRRGRIPSDAHAERPVRIRHVSQHDDHRQRLADGSSLRHVCAGRRRRAAVPAEQEVADEPLRRLRVGQTGIARALSGDPGSVLSVRRARHTMSRVLACHVGVR